MTPKADPAPRAGETDAAELPGRVGRRAGEIENPARRRPLATQPIPREGPLPTASVHEYEEFSKVAGGGAAEVYALADAVVHRYQRKAAPGDPDDWRQDAALAIVEGVRRRGRTLADRGYHFEAARLTVALAISRALAVVHLSEHAAERGLAAQLQGRIPIAGCGYAPPNDNDIVRGKTQRRANVVTAASGAAKEILAIQLEDPGPAPDQQLRNREHRLVLRELIDHLGVGVSRMKRPRDRAVLSKMLGLCGADPLEPAEASWSVGASPRLAHNAVKRLALDVGLDRRAQRLRRNVRVMEEA